MFKDYYKILNIPSSASLDDIKNAYRTQAKKWHPDKNQGVDTTNIMQDINEAYIILKDEEARKRYDAVYMQYINLNTNKEKKQTTSHTKNTYSEGWKEKESNKAQEFDFDDEILKHWMHNARKQAEQNIKDMIVEFGHSASTGSRTFITIIIIGFASAIIYAFIFLIITHIF